MDPPSPGCSLWQGLLLAASLLAWGPSQAYSQIFISPDSLIGVQGHRGTLVLENTPKEVLEYSWHRGADARAGNMIASYSPPSESWQSGPEHRGRENVSQAGNLVIRSAALNDTGNYTVRVETSNGTQTATAWLEIRELEKSPSLSVNASSGMENLGSLEAVCYTNITRVTWLLNAVPVSSSDRLTVSPDGKVLLIRRLSRYDHTLQCAIESFTEIPLTSNLIFINVTYGPDSMYLWSQPAIFRGDLSAPVGSQVAMKCVSHSVPQPTYRWTHNGSFLSAEAELTFPSLAWEQMGRYRCIVENPGTQLIMYADARVRVPVMVPAEKRSSFSISGPTVVWLIVVTVLSGIYLCGILVYGLISQCSSRTNSGRGVSI